MNRGVKTRAIRLDLHKCLAAQRFMKEEVIRFFVKIVKVGTSR
ncbi:hypothetical protein Pan216_09000 [Planctomycetes bacterium Pan216]|uniref:Uncharacterized protein n=1 Tax=Kolteria novifilia TaxID=2527975 RepID=A0A518AZC4_9BACT|nr:hypothetical protein Pan216_09000 [Planctomycetes bacterium Pan216]